MDVDQWSFTPCLFPSSLTPLSRSALALLPLALAIEPVPRSSVSRWSFPALGCRRDDMPVSVISKTASSSLTSLASWARRERRQRRKFPKDVASFLGRFIFLGKDVPSWQRSQRRRLSCTGNGSSCFKITQRRLNDSKDIYFGGEIRQIQ